MKLLIPFAAAFCTLAFAAPAAAAPVAPAALTAVALEPAQERIVVRERTTVTRSSNYRPRSRYKRVCRVRYRNGDRIRTCRYVRRYR